MKSTTMTLLAATIAITIAPANAQERGATLPPVVLSPDLAAPWVHQLRDERQTQAQPQRPAARNTPTSSSYFPPAPRATTSATGTPRRAAANPQPQTAGIDAAFLPQQVAYSGSEAPGTIVIDTAQRFLYLVGQDGQARRYGVGVGKEGFSWRGRETVSRKAEWPDWRPPASMIARERAKGRILPAHMPGGLENPLGARALYLGSTLYRIHGTNQPWTIGGAVSSGCIRMRNEDVIELYQQVRVGANVVVM